MTRGEAVYVYLCVCVFFFVKLLTPCCLPSNMHVLAMEEMAFPGLITLCFFIFFFFFFFFLSFFLLSFYR